MDFVFFICFFIITGNYVALWGAFLYNVTNFWLFLFKKNNTNGRAKVYK